MSYQKEEDLKLAASDVLEQTQRAVQILKSLEYLHTIDHVLHVRDLIVSQYNCYQANR